MGILADFWHFQSEKDHQRFEEEYFGLTFLAITFNTESCIKQLPTLIGFVALKIIFYPMQEIRNNLRTRPIFFLQGIQNWQLSNSNTF